MESKWNAAVITAALFAVLGSGVQMVSANPRVAQAQQNKTSSATDCSVLSATTVGKILGGSFQGDSPEKAMPMYGGAWGSSCKYHGAGPGGARVDFAIYAEESSAKAKQDFEKYSVAADASKGKPSIGDSAYLVDINKKGLAIYVLKGKVHFSITMNPANQKQLEDLASEVAGHI